VKETAERLRITYRKKQGGLFCQSAHFNRDAAGAPRRTASAFA
jgi:hypothetical protein